MKLQNPKNYNNKDLFLGEINDYLDANDFIIKFDYQGNEVAQYTFASIESFLKLVGIVSSYDHVYQQSRLEAPQQAKLNKLSLNQQPPTGRAIRARSSRTGTELKKKITKAKKTFFAKIQQDVQAFLQPQFTLEELSSSKAESTQRAFFPDIR